MNHLAGKRASLNLAETFGSFQSRLPNRTSPLLTMNRVRHVSISQPPVGHLFDHSTEDFDGGPPIYPGRWQQYNTPDR